MFVALPADLRAAGGLHPDPLRVVFGALASHSALRHPAGALAQRIFGTMTARAVAIRSSSHGHPGKSRMRGIARRHGACRQRAGGSRSPSPWSAAARRRTARGRPVVTMGLMALPASSARYENLRLRHICAPARSPDHPPSTVMVHPRRGAVLAYSRRRWRRAFSVERVGRPALRRRMLPADAVGLYASTSWDLLLSPPWPDPPEEARRVGLAECCARWCRPSA